MYYIVLDPFEIFYTILNGLYIICEVSIMKKLLLLVSISALMVSGASIGATTCMDKSSWKKDSTWHMSPHLTCTPSAGTQKGNMVVCDLVTQNNGKGGIDYIPHFYQKGNDVTSSYPTTVAGNSYSQLCATAWLKYPGH